MAVVLPCSVVGWPDTVTFFQTEFLGGTVVTAKGFFDKFPGAMLKREYLKLKSFLPIQFDYFPIGNMELEQQRPTGLEMMVSLLQAFCDKGYIL